MITIENMDDILNQEYSEEFDKIRKGLVKVSFYKYGPAKDNFGSGLVDPIESIEMCLRKYRQTKNTEYLADVANYAMFGYMYPQKGAYFKHTDSDGSAGKAGISINEMKEM